MMIRSRALAASAAAALMLAAAPAGAKEGMFTPDQLPEIAEDLAATGLELDAATMTDLTAFPMGAVIWLGGCTASFVSPQGLAVTNHHCARGSIQFNSTEQNNYLADGFYAETLEAELPAAPGSRIYVTVDLQDVTEEVTGGLDEGLSGLERFQAIEERQKALVAACEEDKGHRCQVRAFYGGLDYRLIKTLEIRDVRLAYAPADSIGKYGGDIDNWMWPRHTGDFAFYRAYVGPDGQPADYAEDNVPYAPPHHLKVSAAGLEEGDFVMAAGYPGRTARYTRLAEVEYNFDWFYPVYQDILEDWIAVIEDAAPEGSDTRIKYESRLAGLNNVMKNLGGQISGAKRVGLVERRAEREAALNAWIAEDEARAPYAEAIAALDALSREQAAANQEGFWYDYVRRPQLLGAARNLYRLAYERQKPDAERAPGYQDRDMAFFKQRLDLIERRYDPAVDKAEWLLFLERYMAQPASLRVAAFDQALGLGETFDRAAVSKSLDALYDGTILSDAEARRALMDHTFEGLTAFNDPFMQLAAEIFEHDMALEEAQKERAGQRAKLEPGYMAAIIAWAADQGASAYPDANSTLRVTYGTVLGGSPQDGLIYEPFTRLEGITAKDTGEDPFNSPQSQLDLIEAKDYGAYALESLGTVPVNFLSDLDSTGGNSGSPTLNGKGELVGLLFDGTIESVNSDWDFDPRTTRTIHVDTRYMLWVMEKVDGAQRLIDEMTLVR